MADNVADRETFKIELARSDWRFCMTVSVPKTPMRPGEMLPLVRTLASSVIDAATQSVEESGQKISCQKGCGACCRQLVAISVIEAQELAELVATLPAERQAIIRARFDRAVHSLEDAGLLDPNEPIGERALSIDNCGSRETNLQELSRRYFRQRLACPFLEDESCSIHEARPLVCREYHVTSPAERCARLFEQPVDRVELPFRLGDALIRTSEKILGAPAYSIPLVLALEWSETNAASLKQVHDGAEMFETIINELAREPDTTVQYQRL
jgi:Fe-S-cluster containining protein